MFGLRRWRTLAVSGSFVLMMHGGTNIRSAAAQGVVLTSGQLEYQQYCASCHGTGGKGNGPMAELWKKPPTDLTALSRKHHGQFPFWRVYHTIDGREEVLSHGTRAMPIWGGRFLMQEGGAPLDEHTVLGRILALVYYVESLQQK